MRHVPVILAAAITLWAVPAFSAEHAAEHEGGLLETAERVGSLDTLVTAVKAAGLTDTLAGDGPFTVFAPTDAAFSALPDGTVAALLEPGNVAALRRVLGFHVVPGHLRSHDLLRAQSARSLSGDALPYGLRVGAANVVRADIECENGVIHVIDAVLIPVERSSTEEPMDVQLLLTEAVERGAPVFNAGDAEQCARIYRDAARRAASSPAIRDLHRLRLADALTAPVAGAKEEAWSLRGALDAILADLRFEPRIEAPLPAGFPAAGPVGAAVVKEYPRYRAARADGGGAFWQLFEHIKKNDVAMTAPVEMTLDTGFAMRDMAFLYERPDQGAPGAQGSVAVLDLEPVRVLSVGVRGERDGAALDRAGRALEARLAADGLRPAAASMSSRVGIDGEVPNLHVDSAAPTRAKSMHSSNGQPRAK